MPTTDTYIVKDSSADDQIEKMRLRVIQNSSCPILLVEMVTICVVCFPGEE